jgi:hypothetical protein
MQRVLPGRLAKELVFNLRWGKAFFSLPQCPDQFCDQLSHLFSMATED